jgi:hypothetical protein
MGAYPSEIKSSGGYLSKFRNTYRFSWTLIRPRIIAFQSDMLERRMKRRASSKLWSPYVAWSEPCEHLHGVPLNDAFKQFVGEHSSLGSFRQQIENELPTLPELEQKAVVQIYGEKVRRKQTAFAQRVMSGHYYTTGIRFPHPQLPVREHIPPELWVDSRINHERNAVGFVDRDPHGRRITYVDVLVGASFWHSDDYEIVAIRNLRFCLNKTQAHIVRLLHQALKAGNQGGLFAKRLLNDVGRQSNDLGDYFKDQKDWRLLIVKTTPGRYRLDTDRL